MKILHLLYESKGDYFGIGGVGVRAYELYKFIGKRHDITLLCKKYKGAKDGVINGIKHVFCGIESNSLTVALLSYALFASIYVRLNGHKYDVIIEEFSPAIPTFLYSYRKRPLVAQIQGFTGWRYFGKYNPIYALTLFVFEHIFPKLYKNLILVNAVTARRLNLPKDINMAVIPNGIDETLLKAPMGEDSYILYLGRIDIHTKRLDLLIKAYEDVYKSYPEIKLVIAGDGRDMEKLNTILSGLDEKIRKNISLPGWVEKEQKLEYLSNAFIVVLPSQYEVQPITVTEALAAGRAVVVSDIEELEAAVKAGLCVSFKSGDYKSLAAQIINLIKDTELRHTLGRTGRQWACDYHWEKLSADFENFLLTL
ncbi:MAG: glycosyltransferase family 4 protein [Nitrospirae bacterium]|nr:glycosyltransferase family 4 protein [Nitrospirota bacterium]MBF0534419.1 glycosyltransferase family 4 protein [Nitrospirota bacterium]MBF0615600.1 glycosyltransferase family 4 protein [Nitrospirota bacterium]